MAEPIPFSGARRNPRAELMHRLARAPEEHAEALLDAYEVLQELRDKGLLEILKGLLGSGGKVLQILTETLEGKDVVRTVRNLTILLKIVGSLDPGMLERMMSALATEVAEAREKTPPGLVKILRQMSGRDARRALGFIAAATESMGQELKAAEMPPPQEPRPRIFRHRIG